MNQQTQIADDITKLILSLKPSASVNFQSNMKTYSKRVLGSYISNNSQQTAQTLKQKIISKVSNQWDNKSVLHCQQTITNILLSNTVQKKPQLLKMLLKTSDLVQKNTKNYSNVFKQSKVQPLNQTQQTIYSNNNNFSMAFMKQRKTMSQSQISILRNRGSVQQDISESDILRQITYTLQNIQATIITKDHERDTYQLQSNINVSETVRKIVSELCDIGWLYEKITNSLSEKGSVQKSLFLAVQEQLNEYYRWLAVIENMIKMKELSLRKLILWSFEPMQKLKWLAIFLEAIQSYEGCQIISIINSYRPQGSQSINDLLNRLLGHLVQPLLQFIHNWVYKGELLDEHKQFFIEQREKINENLQWFQKFTLIEKNIPNILDKQSALMIFNAGKTLYFLKNRCKCNYSLSIAFINPNQILSKQICESSNILSLQFKKWLQSVYEDVSKKLVDILNSQFNLKYHLNSMKHFYLMGKGDFIQHLVDSLKQQLLKAKHQIYEHTLDGYISDAMGKSFSDFKLPNKVKQGKNQKISFENSYRANIVDRLISKKVDYGESSWDSFNFQYSMEKIQPLYSVIRPDFITNYQKIFHFLWKIKRIEQALKQIWLLHLKQFPRRKNNQYDLQGSRLLHQCYLLRTNMSHFLNNFFGYLMIAIESSWDRFEQSLIKSKSLDEIIREHTILQNQILNITFNTPSKKILAQSLQNILKCIERFRVLENKMLNQFSDYTERVRSYENRRRIAQKGILQFQQQNFEKDFPQLAEEEMTTRLVQIDEVYNQTFRTFYENLKKQTEDVSVLLFRLDFSEYYAMKQITQNHLI